MQLIWAAHSVCSRPLSLPARGLPQTKTRMLIIMPNKGVTHPAKVSCSEERPVALRVWQVEREVSRPAAQGLPTHHSRGIINPELPWGEND